MAGISFGFVVSFPGAVPEPRFLVRLASRAEELGFDSIAVGDHMLASRIFLEPLTLLTLFASCTSRLTLMTDALLLPLRHPALLAKTVATLDFISSGRTVLAIGIGGENPKEFELCSVPPNERGRRADEALTVLRELWTQSPANHEGAFWRFEDVALTPKPVQPNGPPLIVGGRSDAALRRAARFGDGWISYLMTPERHKSSVERIRAFAVDLGRDLAGFQLVHHQHIHVSASRQVARDKAVAYLSLAYNQSFQTLAEKYCAIGTPDDCIRWIERFVAAGVQHFIFEPTCPTDQLLDQLEICAAEIMPHFKR